MTYSPAVNCSTWTIAGDGGYWSNGIWYQWAPAGRTTAPAAVTPVAAHAQGWQCAGCGLVLAPWVPSHECPKSAAAEPQFLAKNDPAAGGDAG
jgi:hypothetical protein